MSDKMTGGFTLPGESGYEALTLELAKRWGADVIRDSDGTQLSDEILEAGYGIYSTICIIRDHNEWAEKNLDKLQQTFLITEPKVAVDTYLAINLMEGFFDQQLKVNDTDGAMVYWQVYDRTTGEMIPCDKWHYDAETGNVVISGIDPWHKYTVSFLAYRLWEAISMYNHTTNNWDKEHLMPIDPMYEETQTYLLAYMDDWCRSHEATTVVRFTSMFYNFVWMWGSSEKKRHLFTDWGSYDFTVSVRALEKFEDQFGYRMTAEDFVNAGKFNVSHIPSNQRKLDWMDFINAFVVDFGSKLVDIVHDYGKFAYVFYDDSWVGIEPYGDRFEQFGFDGMIKCVFSGYEARLCSGVKAETHELRLHPYLFPVGLGGAPTFMEGGDPTLDAKQYWVSIRRALLREPVDRIGLGGYLSLTEPFPDFVDAIEAISQEFRQIKAFHDMGKPYVIKQKVAVLHSWGYLRSWTLSGHFHETDGHDLIHINEALSGLPVDVDFINFKDVTEGRLDDYDVIINAGFAGSAWSGGDHWNDAKLVAALTQWVYNGGKFIGIGEPSAVHGHDTLFRMSHVLGVDKDTGARICHGRWAYEVSDSQTLLPKGASVSTCNKIYLTDEGAQVISGSSEAIGAVVNAFGKGQGIYLSDYKFTPENARMLLNLISAGDTVMQEELYLTDNVKTESSYYPENGILSVINNSGEVQNAEVKTPSGLQSFTLEPYGMVFRQI